jgi:ATP-dependent Clp protease adapter protein ClpS
MIEEEIAQDTTTGITNDLGSTVILFNDNIHSFDEVASQLVKVIGCSYEVGSQYALIVHTKGKAAVFQGTFEECLKVSSILEEIALHTQIET